jgi:hypothetical protein
MEPFQFGFLEAIFKVIEERIPFGRAITTIASFLLIAAVIVFCASYLFSAVVSVFAGVHISSGFPSLPDWHSLLFGFFAFGMAALWIWVKISEARDVRLEKERSVRRQTETLELLKKLTHEKLPNGSDS